MVYSEEVPWQLHGVTEENHELRTANLSAVNPDKGLLNVKQECESLYFHINKLITDSFYQIMACDMSCKNKMKFLSVLNN